AGGQATRVRLRGVRQLRARAHGVRLPTDLPQALAERSVWRDTTRPLRGGGPAVHLGGSVRTGARRRPRGGARRLCPATRSLTRRDELLDQLFSRAGQPAGALGRHENSSAAELAGHVSTVSNYR